MTKLNQLLAYQKTVTAGANDGVTKSYHAVQRTALFAGITKTYAPRDEEGERLPGEVNRVQVAVPAVVSTFRDSLVKLFDVTASKDSTNQIAKADIVLPDGKVLVADVSVSTLLFVEKQLIDIATFVKKLPLLDPAEVWEPSDQNGVWRTPPRVTARTKKVPRNHVKARATDKHPEQVELYYEDVVVGDWSTTILSGALPAREVQSMLANIETLAVAVKKARETANMTEVVDKHIGSAILGYVFQ